LCGARICLFVFSCTLFWGSVSNSVVLSESSLLILALLRQANYRVVFLRASLCLFAQSIACPSAPSRLCIVEQSFAFFAELSARRFCTARIAFLLSEISLFLKTCAVPFSILRQGLV